MNGEKRFNPLDRDALTSDDVSDGDRIIVWDPKVPGSVRRITIVTSPYTDDDGDMVVEIDGGDGRTKTMTTSEAGLTGGRYDGIWTHIARYDENNED